MKYSLADYSLSIQSNDSTLRNIFQNLVIGGEGNAIGSIKVSLDKEMWSTEGFATGAWVHNKSLQKTGSVVINISQLSDKIEKLKQIINIFYGGDYEGFTLSISDNTGVKVCTCLDCYVEKIPDQEFSETAGRQDWTFLCGQITFD